MDEQESLEISARTVSDAINRAVQQLHRSKEQLNITVLSEGRSGILGIGGEDARILVSVKDEAQAPARTQEAAPAARAAAPPSRAAPAPAHPAEREGGEARRRGGDQDERPEEDVLAEGQKVLESLLLRMRIFADVEVEEREAGPVLNVVGDDLGILIGRRGDTLAALQFVTNLIVARKTRRWSRLTVDVEDYRARREQTLRGLAVRMAERVQQTGQPFMLEAMPAGERRIVHIALASHPFVTTGSIGEGENRKVVISPKR